MREELNQVVSQIEGEIVEKQRQIALLKSLDFTKPIDEDAWHELCETPLRGSELLGVLVKNTFPLAENIVVHCNYVYFDLFGFKVQIPTSRRRGINVDTSWYKDGRREEPRFRYTTVIQCLNNYFNAVDNKKGWYECAKNRLMGYKSCKWKLCLAWFLHYKWKKVDRKLFEERKAQEEKAYDDNLKAYQDNKKEIEHKIYMLFDVLLPTIEKFSSKHDMYNDGWGYSVGEIRELENK